jgi:hypothetical protein
MLEERDDGEAALPPILPDPWRLQVRHDGHVWQDDPPPAGAQLRLQGERTGHQIDATQHSSPPGAATVLSQQHSLHSAPQAACDQRTNPVMAIRTPPNHKALSLLAPNPPAPLPPPRQGPHFWDETSWPPPKEQKPPRDFDWYVDVFSGAAKKMAEDPSAVTGEASSNTYSGVYTYLRCAGHTGACGAQGTQGPVVLRRAGQGSRHAGNWVGQQACRQLGGAPGMQATLPAACMLLHSWMEATPQHLAPQLLRPVPSTPALHSHATSCRCVYYHTVP